MHELSLCEAMLGIMEEQARKRGFRKIYRVCLGVGILSSVEPEALKFSFDIVTKGTLAQGAQLEIEIIPASAQCFSCGYQMGILNYDDLCPNCGGQQFQIEDADALCIQQLEVK